MTNGRISILMNNRLFKASKKEKESYPFYKQIATIRSKDAMRFLAVIFFVIVYCPDTFSQLPVVTTGSIERHENFQSVYVTQRHIDVWLPEGYNKNKKYAVLYMHDGQMLFDSNITWNKQAWEADTIAGRLIQSGSVNEFIIVGIWNGGQTRHKDYFPQKPYDDLTQSQKAIIVKQLQDAGRTKETFQPGSDNYLKFMVEELKPFIDKRYSTYKNRRNTFIAGSSMGGLISMYAICEYPKVFGGAACLSTHWPGTFSLENNPVPAAFINYMKSNLPKPKTHKIYFDYGDQTLDALYPPLQQKADTVMIEKGFNSTNWMTRFFPGENHSEQAWSKRLEAPLLFLLKKND